MPTHPAAVALRPENAAVPVRLASDDVALLSNSEPAERTATGVVGAIAVRLREAIGPERFERYFAAPGALHMRDGCLEVRVGSRMLAQLCDQHFREALAQCAASASGAAVDVRFVVVAGEQSPALGIAPADAPTASGASACAPPAAVSGVPGRRVGRARAMQFPSRSLPRFALDQFIVAPCNRLAHEAAMKLADHEHMGVTSPLYVHGACGLGKTHLLAAMVQRMAERRGPGAARYTTAEEFVNDFIASVRGKTVEAFRKSYRHLDMLCVDDIQALEGKTATQVELQHTIDAVAARGGVVAIAGPVHPRRLTGISPKLVSRFGAGLVASLESPDGAAMDLLVRALAARRGLRLDESAVRAVTAATAGTGATPGSAAGSAARCSVRDLEGLLTKVDAVHRLLLGGDAGAAAGVRAASGQSGQHASAVGMLAVRRALGGEGGAGGAAGGGAARGHGARPVRVEAITTAVCNKLGVTIEELAGHKRHERVVLARAVTAHLTRRLTSMSFPEIARAMGRPNHSTIITAVQRLQRQIQSGLRVVVDPARGEMDVQTLCDEIGSSLRPV